MKHALVDFPSAVVEAGRAAGLVPVERCVALLAGVRGGQLIARPSFFQLDAVRKARARAKPWHLIVHEDVLVFASSSGTPKPAQPENGQITAIPAAADLTSPRDKSADAAGPGRKASRARAPSAPAARGGAAPTATARAPQPEAQRAAVSAAADPGRARKRQRAA